MVKESTAAARFLASRLVLDDVSIMGAVGALEFAKQAVVSASCHWLNSVAPARSEWIVYLCVRPVLALTAQRLTVRGNSLRELF